MKFKISFLILLFVLFSASILYSGFRNHVYDSVHKFKYINKISPNFQPSVFDSNLDTNVSAKGYAPFLISLGGQSHRIGKVSVLSELPLRKIKITDMSSNLGDLNIYFQNSHDKYPWIYEYRNVFNSANFLVTVGDVDSKNEIKIKEIAVFESTDRNLFESVFNFVFVLQRNIFSYYYYLGLLVLVFGFFFYPTIKRNFMLNDLVSILVSIVFSTFYFAVVGILYIWLKQEFLAQILFLCSFILSLRNFLVSDFQFNLFHKNMIFIWGLFLSVLISLNIFLDYSDRSILVWDALYDHQHTFTFPYKNYEQDYITPYSAAKVWIHSLQRDSDSAKKIMGVNWITDRPPFMSFVPTGLFPSFGERFFTFELIGLFLSSTLSITCLLFLKKLFNENIAVLSTLLFLGSSFLLFFYKLTQTKMISLSFVFLAGYLIFKKTKPALLHLAALVFTSGYMFQSVAVVFIGLWMLKIRSFLTNKKLVVSFIIPLVVFISWSLYVKIYNPPTAISSYFFATDYYDLVDAQIENKPLSIEYNFTNFVKWVFNKGYNFMGLFLENPHPTIVKTWNSYRNTLIGTLGYSVFPICLFAFIRYFKQNKKASFLILSSILIYILSLGFYNDLGLMFYLCGIIPILIGYAFNLVFDKKLKFLGLLLISFSFIENFYVTFKLNFYIPINEIKSFWLYSGNEFRFGFVLLVISLISLFLKAYYELLRRI